jgi:hypothetical protein
MTAAWPPSAPAAADAVLRAADASSPPRWVNPFRNACSPAAGRSIMSIPDPPQTYVGGPSYSSPPVDNSSDDRAALQRDQDNLQQMINQQNQNNIQQQNMDQFDQQQQIINNNRLND